MNSLCFAVLFTYKPYCSSDAPNFAILHRLTLSPLHQSILCSFLRSLIARTVCKTVRPILSDLCLSVLSVTLVYCGQTVEWTKMPLDTEVGLGPGHIVLHENPASPQRKGHSTPTLRLMSIVAKRSPISASAEFLFLIMMLFTKSHFMAR